MKTYVRHRTSAALVLGVLSLQGCGGGDGATEPPPPQANRNPTAVITANPLEVARNDGNTTIVTLDGTGSTDPDGDALTFQWTAANGTFKNGTNSSSAVAEVSFPGNADYAVTLTVNDGQGGTNQAQVVIEVVDPANQTPVASLESSASSVPRNDRNRTVVTFDGSASSDADGDPLTFSWAVAGGTFVGGTSSTSASPQVSFPGNANYTVTLTVNDGMGGTGEAQTTITLGDIIERADPSFSIDVQEVFERRGCTSGGCHGFDPGSAGLDLRTASAFGELVNVIATSENIVRVIPGDADGSFIVIKLEGRQTVGLQMPRGGTPLNAVDLANIKNWIAAGANNN